MNKQLYILLAAALVAVFVSAEDNSADTTQNSVNCGIAEECNGHGKCKKTVTEHGVTGFCECHQGYTGEFCSTLNCGADEKCNGHGKCILHALGLNIGSSCQCDEGYTGVHCGINLNIHCGIFENCNGNGQCKKTAYENGVTGYCECNEGYSGKFCGTKDSGCGFKSECSGHGKCLLRAIGTSITFSCSCDEGYTGEYCNKVSICERSENACKPNFKCGDLDDGYECVCDSAISSEGKCEKKQGSTGTSGTSSGPVATRAKQLEKVLRRINYKNGNHLKTV